MLGINIALLAILIVLGISYYPIYKNKKGDPADDIEVLLILGCKVKIDKAEETLSYRIKRAGEYLKEHKNVLAIPCGGIVQKDQIKSEAEVMKDELVSLGIEEERIILEDKSKTTEENFKNARAILERMNLQNESIAFLSSDFHLYRSKKIAEENGFKNIKAIAAKTPESKAFIYSLREAGIVFYLFIKKIGGKN